MPLARLAAIQEVSYIFLAKANSASYLQVADLLFHFVDS